MKEVRTKFKHTKIIEEANSESISVFWGVFLVFFFFHFYFHSLVGEKTIQVTHGCNRENTTVLIVASADGKVMDPLIIFKGKNLQSSWFSKNTLRDTYLAVSESR